MVRGANEIDCEPPALLSVVEFGLGFPVASEGFASNSVRRITCVGIRVRLGFGAEVRVKGQGPGCLTLQGFGVKHRQEKLGFAVKY